MNKMNKTSLPSPCYILEEDLLRQNLTLIRDVAQRAGVEIILAFKAYALWKTFPIIREYVPHSTASSIYEAQLAYEEMGAKAHTFSPAYTREEFPTILRYSSHVTFNSLSQIEQMRPLMPTDGSVSFGLRVNPEYSAVETDLYNPCAPGSRFGVPAAELTELPEGSRASTSTRSVRGRRRIWRRRYRSSRRTSGTSSLASSGSIWAVAI